MARRLALSWLLSEGWQYLIPPQSTARASLCSVSSLTCEQIPLFQCGDINVAHTLNLWTVGFIKLVLYSIFAGFFVPSSKCTGVLRNNQHQSHPDCYCFLLRGTIARYFTSLIKSLISMWTAKIYRIYAKYLPQYLPTVPQQESLGAVIKNHYTHISKLYNHDIFWWNTITWRMTGLFLSQHYSIVVIIIIITLLK